MIIKINAPDDAELMHIASCSEHLLAYYQAFSDEEFFDERTGLVATITQVSKAGNIFIDVKRNES